MKLDTATLKRYLSPHAYKDLDTFLEQMPVRAGHGMIIAGVCAWVFAGISVVYVTTQANHIMELRADILKAEALKPTVPVINKTPIAATEVEGFAKKLAELYPQLSVSGVGSKIEMRGPSTDRYGAFREAIGHSFNGGKGWRLGVDTFCVGRECPNNTPLFGSFSVHRLSVEKPAG